MDQLNTGRQEELPEEQGLDLRKYWLIFLARKWMIAGVTIAITVLTALVVSGIPSRYEATATLMFETNRANLLSVEEIYDAGSQRREYILTQTEMLQSRAIAERVIARLGLLEHPEFNPRLESVGWNPMRWLSFISSSEDSVEAAQSDRLRMEKVTTSFLRRLTVEPKRNTQLVTVSFEAMSPQLAADAANAVVEEYISSQTEARVQLTSRATSWLTERLDTLRVKLEESEQALQEFREAEDLVDISGVRSLAGQDLNGMTQQLQVMRQELNQVASLYEQVQDSDPLDLANVPEILSNPMIQEIKRSEAAASRNVAELSRRYGPKHPQMIDANNALQMVREQLRKEVGNLTDSIENRYLNAQARVRAQERALEAAKAEYQDVSRKEVRYEELKGQAQVNRDLFNAFLTRVNETRETSGFDSAAATLADPAVPPLDPVKPNKRMLVAGALAAALFFSLFLAIVLDFLHVGVRSPDDVEIYLGQRLVGLLPDVRRVSGERLSLRTFFDPESYTFGEAVRTMRTGVVLSHFGETGHVIAVTSSLPGEGKTTVTENLSFALAQVEKILVIDADMRKPSLAGDFGLPDSQPGLTDLMLGTSAIEDCIYRDSESGVDVIPSGAFCSDPQKLLVGTKFGEVIKSLAKSYDRIIIDTPPVQAVSDALVIARCADSVLYVVKYDATNKRMISRGMARFAQTGIKVDGVVLNQVDLKASAIYGDEYYGYDYGYGYGKSDAADKDGRAEPSIKPALVEGEKEVV